MAEGLLFNTIEKLIGKLGTLAFEAWNVRDAVESMSEIVTEMNAVIYDAEEQQQNGGSNNSHQVQLWLENLKDAAVDAEDLLDEFSIEHLRRQVMTKHKKAKEVRIFFSSSNQVIFSFKMAPKIKDLMKRIRDLNIEGRFFNFTSNRTPREQRAINQRETHSYVREEEVIGREKEKKELIEELLNTNINEKNNVSIISIIGFGGLGKTTLAQLVYNEEVVQQHFELKKWVCVADNEVSKAEGFSVKGIAARIAESNSAEELDQVQQRLRDKVEGKRYIVVLDDLWNEDHDQWLNLMTLLKGGAKGSKIIVTTRSEKVAKISGASSRLFLKGLDEEKSWKLFSRLAFENGKEPENPKLVPIGKEIVKKCAGVPLAIRSIGSLMYSMETEKHWSSFKTKDLMKIDEEGGNAIFQLINLSYDHLPFHLKKCFAFCSLFPKDYVIHGKMLIRLWVAQSFVVSEDESTSLEDTGENYLTTLVQRSFFQDVEEDDFGGILNFKMHDLMHDLASHISGNHYVLANDKRQQDFHKQTRHVSFDCLIDYSQKVSSSLEVCKLRTLLLPPNEIYQQQSLLLPDESSCKFILSCSKQLRVLTNTHLNSTNIPSYISMLKHLRYLDLSNGKFELLPSSITKLYNLETLLLNDCSKLRELPKDLWKMISLRHLEFEECPEVTWMPQGIGQLTNLQTLTRFSFNEISTQNRSAGTNELRELNNLRGALHITGLECLRRNPIVAGKDMNLLGQHLQSLRMEWFEVLGYDNVELEKDDITMQELCLHPNLKDLDLLGFSSKTLSCSIKSLVNLKKLTLSDCTRLQYISQLQDLPQLQEINLTDLPSLEWVFNDNNGGGSSSRFSSQLMLIALNSLPNLKSWCRCNEEELQWGCRHQFQNLNYLFILSCPNLISVPRNTKIRVGYFEDVKQEVLLQAVNHSIVEKLTINSVFDLKSLSKVLQHLTTLQRLYISNCNELDPCNDDEDGCYTMQWQELKNLVQLTFHNIPKLKSLPKGLQHVTTLHTLGINNCPSLTSIPEWTTSLQVLRILNCPNLRKGAPS